MIGRGSDKNKSNEAHFTYLGKWALRPMLGPGCGLARLRTVENFEAATLAVGGGEAFCTSPLNHLPLSETVEWLKKHVHLSVAFSAL